METRANYIMVGSFVLILVLGLVAFVVWLGGYQAERQLTRYNIHYAGSVTGLREGSPVRYSGVHVGQVVGIRLDPDNPGEVIITVEIDESTPVRANTIATLQLEGLTGGRSILLSGNGMSGPPVTKIDQFDMPVIASKPSPLDQLVQGAPEVVEGVNMLLARGNDLLKDENREAITRMLANLALVSDALAGKRESIEEIVANAGEIMANLRDATGALEAMAVALKEDSNRLTTRTEEALGSVDTAAETISSQVKVITTDMHEILGDLKQSSKNFAGTAEELEAMIAENRAPIRDFTSTGLYEMSNLLIQARDLLSSLNRITTEVQRDPARFLFGNQQEGYETPAR